MTTGEEQSRMVAEPMPILLQEPNCKWGVYNPVTGGCIRDPIASMCDFGAAQFRAGECDLVNFDCMPFEVEAIKKFMAEHYPEVRISFGSARRTLATAIDVWKNEPGCRRTVIENA